MKFDSLPRVTRTIWTDLLKAAANNGGPNKLVEKIFTSGRNTGRLEGVGIIGGVVLFVSLVNGATKIGDRIQKKKVAKFAEEMAETIRNKEQNQTNDNQDAIGSENLNPDTSE